jgi:TRAP-type C4-dicarboxylate transport system permease large subunit
VTRTIWPFYIAMLIVLGLVTYVPAISLWLPRLLLD